MKNYTFPLTEELIQENYYSNGFRRQIPLELLLSMEDFKTQKQKVLF